MNVSSYIYQATVYECSMYMNVESLDVVVGQGYDYVSSRNTSIPSIVTTRGVVVTRYIKATG